MIHDGKPLLCGCHSGPGPGPVQSGGPVPVGLHLVGPVPVALENMFKIFWPAFWPARLSLQPGAFVAKIFWPATFWPVLAGILAGTSLAAVRRVRGQKFWSRGQN